MSHRAYILTLSALLLCACRTTVRWPGGEMSVTGRAVAEHTEISGDKTVTHKIDTSQELFLKSLFAKTFNWLGRGLDNTTAKVGK